MRHKFSLSQIKERAYNLDISWFKDDGLEDPNSLPEPHILAGDAISELNACVDELREILTLIDAPVCDEGIGFGGEDLA